MTMLVWNLNSFLKYDVDMESWYRPSADYLLSREIKYSTEADVHIYAGLGIWKNMRKFKVL
jgi:hypothetical protein